tara:strand:- start:10851 stop:11597 length:747 start_codon:yes stop_codon:yes gene_type:complete
MKNIVQDINKNYLCNPERIVMIFPISIGIVISIIFSLILIRPTLTKNKLLLNTISEYKEKKEKIPFLVNRLDNINKEIKLKRSQKNNIIFLIGGDLNLNTLMATINQLSNSNGLKITLVKPKSINKFVATELPFPNNSVTSNSSPNINSTGSQAISKVNTNNNLTSRDNLLIEGLEHHIVEAELEGDYSKILNFIRDLELLENITFPTDMEISSYENKESNMVNKIRISGIFSAYGKILNENHEDKSK